MTTKKRAIKSADVQFVGALPEDVETDVDDVSYDDLVEVVSPGPKLGLYRRFRNYPRSFPDLPRPGSYMADIYGCPLACRQCWSSYGKAGLAGAKWLTPEEAATRLIAGMRRNNHMVGSITNGESFSYAEHIVALAEEFCRLRAHDEYLWIETNAINALPAHLDALDRIAARTHPTADFTKGGKFIPPIWVAFSIKSATKLNYIWLTGAPGVAYDKIWENFRHALTKTKRIGLVANMFSGLAENARALERIEFVVNQLRPGFGEIIMLNDTTYFRGEREIDRKMGERRVRTAEREGLLGKRFFTEGELRSNRFDPPEPSLEVDATLEDPSGIGVLPV